MLNLNAFCQGSKKAQSLRETIKVHKTILKRIYKKVRKCDSLSVRYNEQRELITDFSVTTLKLLRENDSLQTRFNIESLKLKEVNEKLIKEKSKKGISIFEGICIGVGAFGLGALIF